MEIGLLGPLLVRDDGGDGVAVGGARVRALLAMLALDAGRTVPATRLMDGLWGERPPANTGNALATLVKRLRGVLRPDSVLVSPPGYLLAVDPGQVDAVRFAQLAAEGRAALRGGDPRSAVQVLDEALGLWRGAALADVLDAPFAAPVAAGLEERRLTAVEDRAEAALALGRHADVAAHLGAEAREHPLRERLAALTMRALAGDGRQSEALEVFERTRSLLAEELGVDPSPVLAEAHLTVLRGDDRTAGRAPARGLRARVTSFVGRDAELSQVAGMLRDAKLVTIVGPGGAGKTRLAVEAGARAEAWPDGVTLVEFASLAAEADVASTVMAALGVREGVRKAGEAADPEGRLTEALAGRRLLLVLDNCEHVVDAVARVADLVLGACPDVRLLATSREPLAVPGEVLFPIPPLRLPPEGAASLEFPAVRLFVDRAEAVRAGRSQDLEAIGAICRELDGLPLAIELAAARARALSPAQILARLDDRFRLLTGGHRTALPRHQTLRAVVEWSWESLAEREAGAARALSVFAGRFGLEDAEAVCGEDVLDPLTALVDKSLVEPDGDRYRMLETIRAYAAGRLNEAGEEAAVRAAHARRFLDTVEAAEPALRTAAQQEALDRIAESHDNALAALRWAVDGGDAALALRLCAALTWYWWFRGQRWEASRQARQVLALTPDGPPDGLVLEHATCLLAAHLADFAHPLDFSSATGAADLAGLAEAFTAVRAEDGPVNPLLLVSGASLLAMTGRSEEALELLDQYAAADDPWLASAAVMMRGSLLVRVEDLESAVTGFRALGDRWGLIQALMLVIQHRALRGGLAEVAPLMDEAEALLDGLLADEEVSATLIRHAYLRLRGGDLDGASRATGRALRHARSGRQRALVQAADAAIAGRRGDFATALPAFRSVLAELAALRTVPFDVAFIRANYARALSASGDFAGAYAQFDEALRSLGPVDDRSLQIMVVIGAAATAGSAGDHEKAVLLLAGCEAVFQAGYANADAVRANEQARVALGGQRYAELREQGAALTRDALLALIRS
ncbi:BTAD domain-containing putative transcriptional regulator [Actinomadura sp. WMMA1423]|uniref:ATP-binding protein n=1 Tax=Actinomadura sp. WMMA1423 TaxID=2591108 RepID=UPI00143CDA91|nr:BTAD domain-containing putative transcriptional regulator [Actinomadura sp. WMMA1423]